MSIQPQSRFTPPAAGAGAVALGNALHRTLLANLSEAGCFRPATVRSFVYGLFILCAYAAAYLFLLTEPGIATRLPTLAALAFLSVHAGFLAHEALHGALTRNRFAAAAVGQIFNTLLTALCYSHFSHIHRLHHPHCNERARDPDMQSGLFSMYREAASAKSGLGKFVSRHQSALIWILVWLQAFSLKFDSLGHLARNPRATRVDQGMLALHAAFWIVPPVLVLGAADALLNYALMTLLIGPYLGIIFLVNHIGTHVVEPGEQVSYFLHEISVTRNLGQTRLHDFFFGGLNNHIEHHLFPSMPTAHLRRARAITRDFCRRHGIEYREMSWLSAARAVTAHFRYISAFVPR